MTTRSPHKQVDALSTLFDWPSSSLGGTEEHDSSSPGSILRTPQRPKWRQPTTKRPPKGNSSSFDPTRRRNGAFPAAPADDFSGRWISLDTHSPHSHTRAAFPFRFPREKCNAASHKATGEHKTRPPSDSSAGSQLKSGRSTHRRRRRKPGGGACAALPRAGPRCRCLLSSLESDDNLEKISLFKMAVCCCRCCSDRITKSR